MKTKTTDPYRTTYHRDGTVSVWDCYEQAWRRIAELDDRLAATLSAAERQRIELHLANHRPGPGGPRGTR